MSGISSVVVCGARVVVRLSEGYLVEGTSVSGDIVSPIVVVSLPEGVVNSRSCETVVPSVVT